MIAIVFWLQQLHANPQQQNGTHDLEVGNGQQSQCKGNQDHAQHNGAQGAINDALGPLLGRQVAAS